MQKNIFSRIMLVLALTTITNFGFCQSEQKILPKEEYIREDFIFIPWGEGEGQIKKYEDKYKDKAGETIIKEATQINFVIDSQGNIYVYDSSSYDKETNIPIQKFNQSRKFVRKFYHKGLNIQSFTFDDKNDKMYVTNGILYREGYKDKILKKKVIKYDKKRYNAEQNLKGLPNYLLNVDTSTVSSLQVSKYLLNKLEIFVIHYWSNNQVKEGEYPPYGGWTLMHGNEKTPSAIKIKGVNNLGSLKNEIVIGPFSEFFDGAELLDIDEEKNLYILVGEHNIKDKRFPYFAVYKVSIDGELLSIVKIRDTNGERIPWTPKIFKDSIYTKVHKKNGIYIYRWTPKREANK